MYVKRIAIDANDEDGLGSEKKCGPLLAQSLAYEGNGASPVAYFGRGTVYLI